MHAYGKAHVWRSEDNLEVSLFSFSVVAPGDLGLVAEPS